MYNIICNKEIHSAEKHLKNILGGNYNEEYQQYLEEDWTRGS